jgi:hypothetical protein
MSKTGRETSSVCEIKRTPRAFCSDRLEPTSRIAMGLKKMTLAWAARSPRSYLERGPSQRYSVLSSRQPSAGNLIAAIPLGVGSDAERSGPLVQPRQTRGRLGVPPWGARLPAATRPYVSLHAEAGSEESADHRDIRRGRLEGLWLEAQDDLQRVL